MFKNQIQEEFKVKSVFYIVYFDEYPRIVILNKKDSFESYTDSIIVHLNVLRNNIYFTFIDLMLSKFNFVINIYILMFYLKYDRK